MFPALGRVLAKNVAHMGVQGRPYLFHELKVIDCQEISFYKYQITEIRNQMVPRE